MKTRKRGEWYIVPQRDDRGFSLMELIVVIAIMAVLIGTVGAQVIPYLNRAKRAKDLQILSAYATASMTAYSEKAEAVPPSETTLVIEVKAGASGDVYTCSTAQVIADGTKELISMDYLSDAGGGFSSKEFQAGNRIVITFDFEEKTLSVRLYKDSVPISGEDEVEAKL